MERICRDVVLCKGEKGLTEGQDSYATAFEGAGYSCQVLTAISFSFVNTQKLRDCLETPESYSGLILTSQRAVEAIKKSISENPLKTLWKELPVYCVGPATENLVRNTLDLPNCMGSESGNAQELAKFIISHHNRDNKSLLYPCSGIARETIQRMLEEAEISVEKITAYETRPSETLENDLLDIMKVSPQIAVFFSPSTAKNVMAIAGKHNLIARIKAVAIGPVTAEALKELGLRIYATAAKPDSQALLKSIEEAQIEISS
ncbi:uroporphyrinogen-III synthase [Fopius arisanus]|uniref:Uroporphyrinogen-III synthase n=1 Tax=Fopius arisanus TaxID=64838 RepID=A0A9R1TTC2_9HYME|nr:PREDICTED: uroporphyrinogen-III synthase-like [Fopius arisanus]XP_011314419.1 PREDICTED: uroporphyrinogen-III synthase-like [Fopius arisanus]